MSRGSHTHLSLCISSVYDNSYKGNSLMTSDEIILHHNVFIVLGSYLMQTQTKPDYVLACFQSDLDASS